MTDGRKIGLTSLLTALVALGPLSTSLYVPSMPALAEAFRTDPALVQRSFTIFLVGFALAQLVYGPLSDRFGRRPVLFGGLVLYVAASIACALSSGIWSFLAARLVQGVGACVGPVIGRAVVRDSFDHAGAVRAYAFIGTALALAPALGPLIGGILQVWLGWQATFGFLVVYGALMLWLVRARLRETNPRRDPNATDVSRLVRNYRDLLTHRRYLGYLLPGTCAFGGLFAYTAASPFLFVDGLGLSPDVFGLLSVFTVSAYAFGSYLAGFVEGRIGGDTAVRIGAAATVGGGVLLVVLSGELTLAAVIVPMMFFVFGFGLLLPASTASALQPFPRIAGSASAMMGFLQMAVGAAGSMVLSGIYEGTALSLGVVVLVLATAGGVGFVLLVPVRPLQG